MINKLHHRISARRLMSAAGCLLVLAIALLISPLFSLDSIGLSSGFNHPLTGWDHLLTMLAVGIWAAQLRGHAIWMLPLSFVGVMSLGGMAGAVGLDLPSVEGIILLSCAVFGVLITRKIRFNAKLNVLIVAFFGFFHGYAHGQEISTSASLISYTVGFMLATLLLHGAGILVTKLVMFSITCVLTLLFSSSALASASHSRLDLQSQPQATADYVEFDRTNAITQTNLTQRSIGVTADSALVTIAPEVPEHWIALQADEHPRLWIKTAASEAPSITRTFKHYYPDINQTPGKTSLSCTAGLTSPPTKVVAPVYPPRFNRLFFSTEEPPLFGRYAQITLKPHPFGYSANRTSPFAIISSPAAARDGYPSDSSYPQNILTAHKQLCLFGLALFYNNKNQPENAL